MANDVPRGAPAFSPVVLEGQSVRLEPLAAAHLPALTEASRDESIWTWYPVSFAGSAFKAFFDDALDMLAKGTGLPFAVIETGSGEPVGSTRFGNIERRHRRAEIGWTWLAPRWQRTRVNTEMKYLMLRHAFEALGLNRVEFKTDSLNEKSRRALERIGAVPEGIFRNHMVTHSGRLRHSAWYSITDGDWPAVKQRFEQQLLRSDVGRQSIADDVGGMGMPPYGERGRE